jgi:hypothetical protein
VVTTSDYESILFSEPYRQDTLSAAIWALNKVAVSIASAVWLANAGSQIHSTFCWLSRQFRTCDPGSGIAIVRAAWRGSLCEITNSPTTKINIFVTTITDCVLLALMFIGLLRWEKAHQRGGTWWLLYTQVHFFLFSRVHGMFHDEILGMITGLSVDNDRHCSGGTRYGMFS